VRILLLTPVLPDADAPWAIPVLLHAQVVGLLEHHDVTVVTSIGDEKGEERAACGLRRDGVDLQIADRRRPPPGTRRMVRQLRLARTWLKGSWPWRTVWFADPAIQAVLDRVSISQRFDVVAVEDSSMAVFRLPAGVRTVLTEHEVRRARNVIWSPGPPSQWPQWALREIDWRRWVPYQRTAWGRFHRVQVFTERDARAIAEMVPTVAERVRVNPFGLVMPSAGDPTREDPALLLFVGNFTHLPNRDAAIWLAGEIMPKLIARHPGARLRIVGSAPPREVRELAGTSIEVQANAPDIQQHLEAASVVVAPVRMGGGMRLKILHAMAAGKPVLTTSRGTEGYIAPGRAAPLVVADDAESIAAAAADLLKDDATRRELGQRGRKFALDHHSPSAWGARLEAVYREACAAR
jgi:glycosyltransferase involved in cell wall biosynthesis